MAQSFIPRLGLPEVTSTRHWARWEVVALFIPLLAFVSLASYKIHAPGLYYDEMFVLSPAFGVPAYRSWFGLPLMISPYVGADKSWFYIPIFALFGVSALTVRLPAILISCGTLVLGYALMRRTLNPRWALAFTVACAVHPAFIFLTKVDWGPQVLMLFLKALCLLLLFRWLEGAPRMCWPIFGIWAFGFLDKFNFVWLIGALVLATPVIYSTEILQKLRRLPRIVLVPVAIGVVVAGGLALWLIRPLLQKPQIHAFSDRLSHIWELYKYTCTGMATAFMWFKSPPALPSWTGWVVVTLTITLLLLTLLAYAGKPSASNPVESRTVRFCLWCVLMFGIIFLEIAFTPQAGGAHHTIMLFPFDLMACFSAAFLFVRVAPVRMRLPVTLLQAVLLLAWAGAEVQSLRVHFSRFGEKANFWGRFSPRIETLAKYLNKEGRQADAIYCVEWGIGNQLIALCQPKIAGKVRDYWPAFQDWSATKPDARATAAQVFKPNERALYVSFSKADPVFLLAQSHFAEMKALAGKPAAIITSLPDELGQTYQVFESPPR